MMPLPSTLQPSAGNVPYSNDGIALARPVLFIQNNRRRLAHCTSKLTKLRIHFFHLFLEMTLIDSAHFLRVFGKSSLCASSNPAATFASANTIALSFISFVVE
jgi:hypothetical protein